MPTIEKKNLFLCVFLSFITCGIYQIIWVIRMMQTCVKLKEPADSAVSEILFGLFMPYLGCYLAEKKLTQACAARGIEHKDCSLMYLILGIAGLAVVDYVLIQNDLNEIADTVNMQNQQAYAAQAQQAPYQQAPYQQ